MATPNIQRTRIAQAPPVFETWPGLMARLARVEDELTGMLEHLASRPPAPVRRKHERELKEWLAAALEWLAAILELGPPSCADEAVDVIHDLYHFDLERSQAVDAFFDLIEEAGETVQLE